MTASGTTISRPAAPTKKYTIEEIETEWARRKLGRFVEQAWHLLEPAHEFKPNWHLDCVAEHLEAVTAGQLTRLLINIPPRHMKPVGVNELVQLNDGRRVKLGEIKPYDIVVTHDGSPGVVVEVHEQGRIPVLKITTWCGRTVIAAHDHPFLTPSGWKNAGDLEPGDTLAAVQPWDRPDAEQEDEAFRLAGYFVGDGNVTTNGGVQASTITCFDPIQVQDIHHCASVLGFKVSCNNTVGRFGISGGSRDWLREIGLAGLTSHTKRVPAFVFQGSRRQIAHYLGAYFSCDGTLTKRGSTRKDLEISFSSVSRGLLEDTQHLLLRLGIRSVVRRHISKNNVFAGPNYLSWRLALHSADETAKFFERVPIFGCKSGRIAEWSPKRVSFDTPYLPDRVMSIEDAGEEECRCLTIDHPARNRSFLANDLAVHNSLATCVFWPVWEWIEHPAYRYVFISYTDDLTKRDAVKARRVIQSPWFQARWGHKFQLTGDQNAKERYENDKTGLRVATSVRGLGTGEGGDRIVVDDPHNVTQGESDAERSFVVNWWKESMSTRGNDPATVARIIIMQRVHEADLAGHAIDTGEYHHLCLPARYEPQRYFADGRPDPIKPHKDCPIYSDPRTETGDLLWKNRFGPEEQDRIEREMESVYAIAAQMAQRPQPREGALFKDEHFKPLPPWFHAPSRSDGKSFADRLIKITFWDLGYGTKKHNDFTSAVTVLIDAEGSIYIVFVWRMKALERDLPTKLAEHIAAIKPDVVGVEADAFRAKETEDLVRLVAKALQGRMAVPVLPVPVSKDKEIRAQVVSNRGDMGMLHADRLSAWWPEYIKEMVAFPNGKNDDMVDGTSGAVALAVVQGELIRRARDAASLQGKYEFGSSTYALAGPEDPQRASRRRAMLGQGDEATDWFAMAEEAMPVDLLAPSRDWRPRRRLQQLGFEVATGGIPELPPEPTLPGRRGVPAPYPPL